MIVESKADVILLRQMVFPAFAYKQRKHWNFWLPTVFRHIPRVFIIADRDEQVNNEGAGVAMAAKTR